MTSLAGGARGNPYLVAPLDNDLQGEVMETVQSVLSILMMIGIGVFVAWKLGFDEKNSAGLASLVINITLPAYMISNILVIFHYLYNLLLGLFQR